VVVGRAPAAEAEVVPEVVVGRAPAAEAEPAPGAARNITLRSLRSRSSPSEKAT